MAPPAGSDCISRPRAAIRDRACGSGITPATQAATSSPTEWPMTASGATPQWRHRLASAYSMAKSAGWVKAVWSSKGAPSAAPNTTSSKGLSSAPSSSAAHSSSAWRNTGSRSYRARPMFTY